MRSMWKMREKRNSQDVRSKSEPPPMELEAVKPPTQSQLLDIPSAKRPSSSELDPLEIKRPNLSEESGALSIEEEEEEEEEIGGGFVPSNFPSTLTEEDGEIHESPIIVIEKPPAISAIQSSKSFAISPTRPPAISDIQSSESFAFSPTQQSQSLLNNFLEKKPGIKTELAYIPPTPAALINPPNQLLVVRSQEKAQDEYEDPESPIEDFTAQRYAQPITPAMSANASTLLAKGTIEADRSNFTIFTPSPSIMEEEASLKDEGSSTSNPGKKKGSNWLNMIMN
jgi:hypothetical protein